MAAARDQAARILHNETESESEAVREVSAAMADQLRHVADEAKRKPAEAPPSPGRPAAAPAATAASEPAKKSGKKRLVLMGVIALLALAAAGAGGRNPGRSSRMKPEA